MGEGAGLGDSGGHVGCGLAGDEVFELGLQRLSDGADGDHGADAARDEFAERGVVEVFIEAAGDEDDGFVEGADAGADGVDVGGFGVVDVAAAIEVADKFAAVRGDAVGFEGLEAGGGGDAEFGAGDESGEDVLHVVAAQEIEVRAGAKGLAVGVEGAVREGEVGGEAEGGEGGAAG